MKYNVHELFELVAKAKTKQEKIDLLKKHNHLSVRDILKAAYDDSITFILPDGDPPYKKADDMPKHMSWTTLYKTSSRIAYFVKGGPGEKLPAAKREKMFIDMLESLHPDEAQLLLWAKNKKLQGKYKGLTKNLVKEVWAKLIVK